MRILRNTMILLFVACALLCGFSVAKELRESDSTYPQIQFESDTIQMALGDGEEKLLEGVTAYDEKDGDLTGEVFVESISNFTSPGVSNVTYVVYDSNQHIARETRTVEYLDYTSPRFVLNHSTVFYVGESISLTDFVHAEDVIDGDISDNIRFSTSSISTAAEGLQSLTVRVTNSKGDESELTLNVRVTGDGRTTPRIGLSEYIVYMDQGASFSPRSYIESVTQADGTPMSVSDVTIENNVFEDEPGVYTVVYSITDENGNRGVTELVVVVEGEEAAE